MMSSIRRNSLPKRANEQVSLEMLSPVESETTASYANSSESDPEDISSQKPSSQLRKLKKVFSRTAINDDSNHSVSQSNHSISKRNMGEEVFRIAINEDSLYEDGPTGKSPRWQRTVGAVVKPPSLQKMDAALGGSSSESEDEGYSSRRSPIRSLVNDDLNLDDSTHAIESLQPPSISSLSTFDKSTRSFGTAATMQMSDSSFRSGKRRGSLGSLYSHGSNRSGKAAFAKANSTRANLGMHSSLHLKEESYTSRTSHIRDDVEQSMDDSTHALPSPGPIHRKLQTDDHKNYYPTIAEVSNSSRSSSQLRSEINSSLNNEDGSSSSEEESSAEGSSHVSRLASSRKGRKSRSPRPTIKARELSGRNKPRRSPPRTHSSGGHPTSPSFLRSSKSPHHKNKMMSSNHGAETLQQFSSRPGFSKQMSSPSMRGERKVLNAPPPAPPPPGEQQQQQRDPRFKVRRTVSSPVGPSQRKQLLPKQGERSERLRRSITDGTIDRDRSRSPSGRQRRSSLVLKSSMNEEVSQRRGVSPVRGKLLGKSSLSERGIRSIYKSPGSLSSPSSKATQRAIARSNSPGIRFRQTPLDKRKSHSTRAERTIPVDMEPFDDDDDVSLRNARGAFYSSYALSFETESGDESLKMEEEESKRVHLRPFRGSLPRSSSEGTNISSSIRSRGNRLAMDPTKSAGVRMDMAGMVSRSSSPGIRFNRSVRQAGKRKSHSTRAERTIPIDIEEPEEANQKGQSKTLAEGVVGDLDSGEKTTLGKKVMNKMKSLRRTSLSMRGNRTIEVEEEEQEPKPENNKVMEKMNSLRRRSLSSRGNRSIEMEVEKEEPKPETSKVSEKMNSLRRRSLSLRKRRSVDVEIEEEEEPKPEGKSLRGRRSVDVEVDEGPKLKSKSSRGRRSIDVELENEEPKVNNKSSRGRRSIDVELDNEEPKVKNKSSRGRRSIDVESDDEDGKGKKNKSSRRERRSIDMELNNEGKGKKSKSSRRGRRSIDTELTEAEGKKTKSSRRERRTLSIDMDFGSPNRKQKSKLSVRRTLSVDSGDSIFENEQPKGLRSLVAESQGDGAKTPTRTRARSRKKDSPKKTSKSPKGKKPKKGDHSDDEGNETSNSTSLDAGSGTIPGDTKPHPSSPSSLLKRLKGIRSERAPSKDAGRSHSPKRSLKPSKSSAGRKLRLSIS